MSKDKVMRFPYFKPTRYKHDSGYRCFEVGYCGVDAKGNAIDIEVLGKYTDHIWSYKSLLGGSRESLTWNMDLLNNGYIRVFSHHGDLVWDAPFGLSSMSWQLKADDPVNDLVVKGHEPPQTHTKSAQSDPKRKANT